MYFSFFYSWLLRAETNHKSLNNFITLLNVGLGNQHELYETINPLDFIDFKGRHSKGNQIFHAADIKSQLSVLHGKNTFSLTWENIPFNFNILSTLFVPFTFSVLPHISSFVYYLKACCPIAWTA